MLQIDGIISLFRVIIFQTLKKNRKGNDSNIEVDLRGKKIDEVKGFGTNLKFNQVVGVINKEDEQRFKRMIFRVTKGNVWMTVLDIE